MNSCHDIGKELLRAGETFEFQKQLRKELLLLFRVIESCAAPADLKLVLQSNDSLAIPVVDEKLQFVYEPDHGFVRGYLLSQKFQKTIYLRRLCTIDLIIVGDLRYVVAGLIATYMGLAEVICTKKAHDL